MRRVQELKANNREVHWNLIEVQKSWRHQAWTPAGGLY